jgi:endonuclease/exonuclease/phosphatase family metal-dependent hydrolase
MQTGSKRILKKMKQGYIYRSEQVKHIVNHIKSSPYPVVVCGDFNDIPGPTPIIKNINYYPMLL